MFLLRNNKNIFSKGYGWPSFELQYYHCFAERQGTVWNCMKWLKLILRVYDWIQSMMEQKCKEGKQ